MRAPRLATALHAQTAGRAAHATGPLRTRHMYCRVIACDLDGTTAVNGILAPEVAQLLCAVRHRGVATVLATGRVLEELRLGLVDFSAFDAVVAENGAVVWLPARGRLVRLGSPPPESFLGRLRDAGIPFQVGAVVVGSWAEHAPRLLELVHQTGIDLQLTFNRGAVMLLPSAVNKAVGVRRALRELNRSPHNLVAFGDAENDVPLFALAERAIAARGAVRAAAAFADERLTQPGPAGVAAWIAGLLASDGMVPTPSRRRLTLGRYDDDGVAALPAGEVRVLVSGDPRSGKSWLAGLVAEAVLDADGTLCLVDPEGEHGALAERPGVLVCGDRVPLPPPAGVGTLLHHGGGSLVLNLVALEVEEKRRYVWSALRAIADERAATGVPGWVMIDEAHYFVGPDDAAGDALLDRRGSVVLVTYRPSLLAPAIYDGLDACLVTRTEIDEERYFIESFLAARGPADLHPADAVGTLYERRAGLLVCGPDGARWRTFTPHPRLHRHTHHARKYVDTVLPEARAFHFRMPNDGVVRASHSVREFVDALRVVPGESLRHHLACGDFSRWARDVLGDSALASGLAQLERPTGEGPPADRDELIERVCACYPV